MSSAVSVFLLFPPHCLLDVMELMFAEWEDGERFSFEDSDRFEEDSLCSFISEAESLCQNWRGWRKQSAGPNSPTVKMKGEVIRFHWDALWTRGSCGAGGLVGEEICRRNAKAAKRSHE